MSWKTAKLIFYIGTLVSLVLFLGLTVDTHRQVETLTPRRSAQPAGGGRKAGVAQVQLQRLPYDSGLWLVLRSRHDQGLLAHRERRDKSGGPHSGKIHLLAEDAAFSRHG